MRIRVKEIQRMHKRKKERYKLLHPGVAVATAAARAATAARSAPARPGSPAARPPRRAAAPAAEA